jgi:hypothetical protein
VAAAFNNYDLELRRVLAIDFQVSGIHVRVNRRSGEIANPLTNSFTFCTVILFVWRVVKLKKSVAGIPFPSVLMK